jgi:glycosyltransferase involved in cell wall biosynthesis
MKIAIFHDYIGAIGGGEKLVLTLARELGADVITTDVDEDSVRKMGFEDVRIISLGETIKIPPLKQISASLKFAMCDFSKKYDFFIFSGNWAHYAAWRHKPNLYYCHTPVRAFYDLKNQVINSQEKLWQRIIAKAWIELHSWFDRCSIKNVNRIITNSQNTQKRIKKYYKRDAVVVYPPVQTTSYYFEKNKDYWLSVNRMYPEKRIWLQFEAFRNLPDEKLKIVGGYSRGDHAEKNLKFLSDVPSNVELLGMVSEDDLLKLYAQCKGLVTTAQDEDFGLTPVEAMASGKPVVAVREGGYLESIVHGETGLLVKPEVPDIMKAIKKISADPDRYRHACEAQAKKFDTAIFIGKTKPEISSAMRHE